MTGNDHEQFWSGGERGDPLADHNYVELTVFDTLPIRTFFLKSYPWVTNDLRKLTFLSRRSRSSLWESRHLDFHIIDDIGGGLFCYFSFTE